MARVQVPIVLAVLFVVSGCLSADATPPETAAADLLFNTVSNPGVKDFKDLLFRKATNKVKTSTGVGGVAECALCKVIVAAIDQKAFASEDSLLKYLDDLCHDLPAPANQDCIDAFALEVPKWWNDIFKNIVTPDEICKLLKVCPPSNTHYSQPSFNVVHQL